MASHACLLACLARARSQHDGPGRMAEKRNTTGLSPLYRIPTPVYTGWSPAPTGDSPCPSMLELTSLALGFTLPHSHATMASLKSSSTVADVTATCIVTSKPTNPARHVWMTPAFAGPSLPRCTISMASVAPAGFVWGQTFVFDERGRATPLGNGARTKAPKKAVPVYSGSRCNGGARLASQVNSWYDSGVRLDTRTALAQPDSAEPPHADNTGDAAAATASDGLVVDELTIKGVIGRGTQSEVRLGELPSNAMAVAIKVALKPQVIAREAAVLSIMSGVPGFPRLIHHEPDSADTPGGANVLELLGPSLTAQTWNEIEGRRMPLPGQVLVHVGRQLLHLLRRLHLAGFVHNDVRAPHHQTHILLATRSLCTSASH
jgi:hypothetical protein